MRLPGYCTGCRKIKQVNVKAIGSAGPMGLCAACEEHPNRPHGELTVYIARATAPQNIPPGAAIVGRAHGQLVEVAYESRSNAPANLAALEERLGRAADRLLAGSPVRRSEVALDQVHAVATFDTRLRRISAVHDRPALGRWLATGGRE
jgi:hypothetical protein